MNKLTSLKLISMVMVLIITNTAMAAAETLTGRVYASVTHNLMPLGNGSAAINTETVGIVAMGGDSPMVYKLTCIGLGIQDTEDKFTNNVYCTFKRNENDRFDIEARLIDGKGNLKVIGGSGRYAGASGKGSYVPSAEGEEGLGLVKFKIKTN